VRELILILPEILLALTLAFVILGEVTYHGERLRLISVTALLGLGSAFLQALLAYQYGAERVFSGTLVVDGLSLFFRLFFIALAMIAVVMSLHSREIAPSRRPEYIALITAGSLGMCIAASAANLLLAFLALQFINLVGYFLAGYSKRSPRSNEAALKFLIVGAVAGALLAYGMAMLFASTQLLNIHEIHRTLVSTPLAATAALVIFLLLFLALAFQMTLFPMHLWASDVFSGAPTPATAFLAIGVRAAGFALAIRFLLVLFAQPALQSGEWQVLGGVPWQGVLALASGVTMIAGSLLALRQTAAKKMVANLVVAESGFLIMGLLVMNEIGVSALLYNLLVQLFAIAGAFYVISHFVNEVRSDRLTELRGMLGRTVFQSVCLILFLVSLIGFPPMPGFIGKFALIGAALQQQRIGLVSVAVLAFALSAIALARLAFALIGDFKKLSGPPIATPLRTKIFLGFLMMPLLLTGIFAEQALGWATKSIGSILW